MMPTSSATEAEGEARKDWIRLEGSQMGGERSDGRQGGAREREGRSVSPSDEREV
jgi:hypothetical protein